MKNKAILLMLFLALVLPMPVAIAQNQPSSEAPIATDGLPNGRFWRLLDHDDKIVWLGAYRNGLAIAFIYSSLPHHLTNSELSEKMQKLYPYRLIASEVVSGVDNFYAVPENGPVAINYAIEFVALKAAGANQSILGEYVSGIRKLIK